MTIRVAINGFGRIGRLFFRIANQSKGIKIVAVNDLVPSDNLAYLLKYDTVHGRYPKNISSTPDTIKVDNEEIQIFSEKDPSKLPWNELKVDYVLESTGLFRTKEKAKAHLDAGAKRVIVSAPGKDDMPTYVMGVNHHLFDPSKDTILCNASCTTNCLAPITKVLLDHFGIKEGLMTTVHSLTASQVTVDGPSHKDWRGGRAAGYNIIPASTGAAKAVGQCIPEVKGKLTGMAFRVPTLDVSVVDLTVKLEKSASYDQIADVMKEESEGNLKGILAYSDEELVSSDIIGSHYSSVFDKKAGIELNDSFHKIVAWYDNEMGYSHRLYDLMRFMAEKEPK
jgi:glyceraldehyde 3-phosphate dehydrogenase